ncbi:hypothetical protein GCM10010530_06650 [Kribbella aluminosa]
MADSGVQAHWPAAVPPAKYWPADFSNISEYCSYVSAAGAGAPAADTRPITKASTLITES